MFAITQYAIVTSITPYQIENGPSGVSLWYSAIIPSEINRNGFRAAGAKPIKTNLSMDQANLFPEQGIYELTGVLRGERFQITNARLIFQIDENLLHNLIKKAA